MTTDSVREISEFYAKFVSEMDYATLVEGQSDEFQLGVNAALSQFGLTLLLKLQQQLLTATRLPSAHEDVAHPDILDFCEEVPDMVSFNPLTGTATIVIGLSR